MTSINKLTRIDTVNAGDVVPIYIQNQGDARGAAMSVLLAYMQGSLDFPSTGIPEFVTQYAAPSATGFSVSITTAASNIHLILTPTGTFAAGTLVLPLASTCVDKQEVLVNCTQIVTALTVSANGATAVTGAPTTLAANAFFRLKFDLPTGTWYRVG
ncbi:hypothetical protein SAMN05660489_04387 [Pseudomonas sp. LAMO17WK12:I10]|uniref:hypothetical protein n=1 Tax=unclassified Pseudomonas TaxID=196821 RepID=UPI000BD3C9BE|nr:MULTISPECIES: hypothetical protein [unclassified Pseudomonas]PXX60687.1 hypothetical protein H160_04363 [Pseudomonas sp. LAMO17WK12:I9]SNY45579.1 hypothetical protein SAMN05660489_04387 [Pseudomonas sp. LAMO17WK12:I10]